MLLRIKRSTKDYEKSYAKVTGSIRLHVDAKTIEAERYKKLSEAERRANEKTFELLRSMDKSSTTAVDAVDATSLDAVKLQSRSFSEMPQMNFAQNAENDLGSAQQELRQIYEKAARIADAFIKEGENRKKTEAESQKTVENRILDGIKAWQDQVKSINDQLKSERDDIFKKMQDYEKTASETIKKLEETNKEAKPSNENYQKNTETSLRQISENTSVFKDWQKATV